MTPHPLRLLISGYALAALTGGLFLAPHAGLLWTGIAVWLGGPFFVVALGLLPGPLFNAAERPAPSELDLAAWDADLAEECRARNAARPMRRLTVVGG
ncbi:MAG: hypothetical protein ACFBSD_11990 [Paracoccaceae bacterium]